MAAFRYTVLVIICLVLLSLLKANSERVNNGSANGVSRFLKEVEAGGSSNNYSPHYDSESETSHGEETSHGSETSHGESGDHVVAHENGGHSLFNTLGLIDPKIAMGAIVIIVAAVLALETVFHMLNEVTRDTTFHRMVASVEKELMLVGCTAFIFKIIVNSDITLSERWFIALEYADLLVPLFAFANCFIGVMLIFMALRQCDVWSKGFHLQLSAILKEYENVQGTWLYKFSLKPMYAVISEMEFRIFHGIFCENFKVQRSAFAFDTYVELVFEKFILEIIKIRPINWVLVILLLLLNIARTKSKLSFFHCDEHDYVCIQFSAAIVFTICGFVMLVVTIFVAVISRFYEIMIIKKSGVASIDRYPQYLKELESMSDFKHEQARLNKDELKMAANASKKRQHSMRRKQPTIIDFLSNPAIIMSSASEQMSYVARRRSTRRRTGLVVPEYHEEDEQQKAPLKVKPTLATITETNNELGQDPSCGGVGESTKQPLFLDGAAAVTTEQKDNGELDLNNLTNLADFAADPEPAPAAVAPSAQPAVASNYAPVPMELEANEVVNLASGGSDRVASPELMQLRSTSSDAPPPIGFVKGDFDPEDVAADLTVSNKEKMESARRYTSYKLNRLVPLTASQASNFLETIFVFSSPTLYFEIVRLLIMLIALYMALWVLNFLGSDISSGWKFLSILPAFLSAINYFYIVKTSSLLRAIYKIDEEAVLEVLENSEGSRLLGIEIREKLLKKLDLMGNGDPRAELRALFNEIDDNGSNRLSRTEFESLMRKMEIHFSRKKWKKIFHQMDFNFDDKISFEEFINFLFPGENNFTTDFVAKSEKE